MLFDDLSSISVAELKAARNWQSQYRLITQWGAIIQRKEFIRVEENLLRGCETSAWLVHEAHEDVHYFAFDSDSRVINGLAALLLSKANAKTAQEISALDFSKLLADVGLEKHLTPSRNNGLKAIIARLETLVG